MDVVSRCGKLETAMTDEAKRAVDDLVSMANTAVRLGVSPVVAEIALNALLGDAADAEFAPLAELMAPQS